MTPSLPLCCSSKSYSLLAKQLPTISSPDALLNGAVAIAQHQMENIDAASVDATLQQYADTVRSRVRGEQPQALLWPTCANFSSKSRFRGNTEDYYNPANSFLPAVIESRKGLPITLSLLYKMVAERVGLRSWGVGMPGHFHNSPSKSMIRQMLIDAFAPGGRILTLD